MAGEKMLFSVMYVGMPGLGEGTMLLSATVRAAVVMLVAFTWVMISGGSAPKNRAVPSECLLSDEMKLLIWLCMLMMLLIRIPGTSDANMNTVLEAVGPLLFGVCVRTMKLPEIIVAMTPLASASARLVSGEMLFSFRTVGTGAEVMVLPPTAVAVAVAFMVIPGVAAVTAMLKASAGLGCRPGKTRTEMSVMVVPVGTATDWPIVGKQLVGGARFGAVALLSAAVANMMGIGCGGPTAIGRPRARSLRRLMASDVGLTDSAELGGAVLVMATVTPLSLACVRVLATAKGSEHGLGVMAAVVAAAV